MPPKTPAELLPSLKSSTEALEAELTEDLIKHAEKSFNAAETFIETALAAVQPLEQSLDNAERQLDKTLQKANHVIKDVVTMAHQQVAASVHNPAKGPVEKRPVEKRDKRDPRGRAKKKAPEKKKVE